MTDHEPTAADELTALLAEYQDVVRRGDRAGFARIYHPTATVSYPDGDQLVTSTAAAFAAEVADMVEAGHVVEERTRGLEVLVAGSVAVMRVEFDLQLADDHFRGTDFYTAVHLGDRWWITHKAYDMASIAGEGASEHVRPPPVYSRQKG